MSQNNKSRAMTNVYLLEQVDIFEDLTPEQLHRIDSLCLHQEYQAGDLIFEENSPSTEFYVILDGEVEIQVDPDTIDNTEHDYQPSTIAILRRGQCFGEVGLVDRGVRSASARSGIEGCALLAANLNEFESLLYADHHMGYVVMRNLAADLSFKIRQTNLMVRESLMYNSRKSE